MDKKFWWVIVLLMAVAGVVTFLLWPKVELSEIKIANITLLSFFAMEKGFLKEEGLRVEVESMSSEDSVSALLAGEVDYVGLGVFTEPTIKTSLRNAPIKTIVFTTGHETFFLIARPELKLKNLKTIGIYCRHCLQHYLVLKFVEKNDLEVEIIAPKTQNVLWSGKELRNLLLSGKVDAILSSPVNALVNPQTQGFPILDAITYVTPSGLSVRNDKIEKEPEEVRKVVRALEKSMELILTRPEETKELLLKRWGPAEKLKKTEEDLAMTAELFYSLLETALDRRNIAADEGAERNIPADEGAELLIQIVKAGEFETIQEVEEQIVTPEDLQKVFDFRFVK